MRADVFKYFGSKIGGKAAGESYWPYFLFLIVGIGWILLSDRALLLLNLPADTLTLTALQSLKGAFFVVGTAIAFYLIGRGVRRELIAADLNIGFLWDVTRSSFDIVWRCDHMGNDFTVLHYSGSDPDEATQLLGEKAVHPDDLMYEARAWARAFKDHQPFITTVRLHVGEGYRYFENRVFPILDKHGTVVEWIGACRDIDDFMSAQETLRRSEEVMRLAAKAGGIGIWEWNQDDDILEVSEEMRRQHGSEISSPGQLRRFIHPADYPDIRKIMMDAKLKSLPYEVQYRIQTRQGETRWILNKGTSYSRSRDLTRRMLGVSIDISQLKRSEERFRFLAYHDALTRLPNRGSGKEWLCKRIDNRSPSEKIFAAVVDIDYFSSLNEIYGQRVGDALLREASERLSRAISETGIVCRFGGDAFMVMCPYSDEEPWQGLIEDVMNCFAEPFTFDGIEVRPDVSSGVALYPEHDDSWEGLWRASQLALYRSKTSSRGEYTLFDASMLSAAVRFEAVRNALKGAVAAGELSVYYQPQLNLHDERVNSFEALLRWNSPVLGPMCPSEFIPIAEKIGMMGQLDAFILHSIASQVEHWRRSQPRAPTISFNLSPASLEVVGSAERFKTMVSESGLNPRDLMLEITETALISNTEVVYENLNKLSAMGFRLSLDDFGTGFSSLHSLMALSLTELKIDRSFVANLPLGEREAGMVRAIISMAHDLGIKVVAEGVETTAQLECLGAWGCDIAQGYFIGRPGPAAGIEASQPEVVD